MAMAHTNGIFIEPMFHQDEAFTSDALEVIKLKFGMIQESNIFKNKERLKMMF